MRKSIGQMLHAELVRKRQKNIRYSLRAFARDLKVSPASLLNMLNDRKVSRSTMSKVLTVLKVPEEQQHRVMALNQEVYQELSNDTFDENEVAGNYYYFAILSLLEIEAVEKSPKEIARKLGLPVPLIQGALACLRRLNLIDEQMNLVARKKVTVGGKKNPMSNTRQVKFQEIRLMEAFLNKMDRDDNFASSDFSSITVATDSSCIPEVRKRIRRFRRQMDKFLSSQPKKEVYIMTIQLWPLVK